MSRWKISIIEYLTFQFKLLKLVVSNNGFDINNFILFYRLIVYMMNVFKILFLKFLFLLFLLVLIALFLPSKSKIAIVEIGLVICFLKSILVFPRIIQVPVIRT